MEKEQMGDKATYKKTPNDQRLFLQYLLRSKN